MLPILSIVKSAKFRDATLPGDTLTVAGSLAKNGSPTINANNIMTADGKRLFAGSSQGNEAGKQ